MKKTIGVILFFLLVFTLLGCERNSSSIKSTFKSLPTITKTNDTKSTSFFTSTKRPSSTTKTSTSPTTITTQDEIIFDKKSLNVTGFAYGKVNDRNSNEIVQVTTVKEFVEAIKDKSTKAIEIMNDLDFGYNILDDTTKKVSTEILRSANKPSLHPTLIKTGVSRIQIKDRNGLTIFSNGGYMIKHLCLAIIRSNDIVIRNLSFSELWEWDEATKGDYDVKDWDYITLESCDGVWIDHCTFAKSYDGLIDSKVDDYTTKNVTISWCKFDPNIDKDFIKEQFLEMEKSRVTYTMYDYLRTIGFTLEEIVKISTPQKKGFLVGQSELNELNKGLTITLAYNYLVDLQDRLPRLRAGNAHVINCLSDASNAHRAYLISKKVQVSSTYKFSVTSQAIVTTENGSVFAQNCWFKGIETIIKNNQKSASKPEYTGKVKILDSIYELSTIYFFGGTDTVNNYFKIGPAQIKDFDYIDISYDYILFEAKDLEEVLINQKYHAGVLNNSDINWLQTGGLN